MVFPHCLAPVKTIKMRFTQLQNQSLEFLSYLVAHTKLKGIRNGSKKGHEKLEIVTFLWAKTPLKNDRVFLTF